MKNWPDCCGHALHEYAGSLKSHNSFGPVDVYFLDLTGGHNNKYHGGCVRYGDDCSEYLSYAEISMAENHNPEIWGMYLEWCKLRGKKPQTREWILNEVTNSILDMEDYD
tara:strand:- start:16 stop:345 length:330 start_codon:yes stop_codon:yes gene_type:complete